MRFEKTQLSIAGETVNAYKVLDVGNGVFRGLQVAVVKYGNGWSAYEVSTGLSITPKSWDGGYSNKTREGIMQIVSNHFASLPQLMWDRIAERLDYDLTIDDDVVANELARMDAEYIQNKLCLFDWKPIENSDYYLAACKPTEAFWMVWHRDRIQIDKRELSVFKEKGRWIVKCFHKEIADLLLKSA